MRPLSVPPRLALLACLAAASGCGDAGVTDYTGQGQSELGTAMVVGSRWVITTTDARDLIIAERVGAGADVRIVHLGTPVRELQGMSDGRLAMLSTETPTLILVDPATGALSTIELPTTYDRLTIRDDASDALAWFSSGSQGPPGSILFNPNSITRVSLTGDPDLREFVVAGPRPQGIEFAPEFTLDDPANPLRLAVVRAASAVSFVDPEAESAADLQRLVRLADPASGTVLTPVDIEFSSDDPADPNDVVCYVLASGASEVFAINLLPADPATGRRLQPAINQLAVGASPASMHLFEVDGQQKLLVTSAYAAALSIVDVSTNAVTDVSLPRVLSSATPYEVDDAGTLRPQALLWSAYDSTLFFADLATLEAQGSNALRARPLAGSLGDVTIVGTATNPRAVARYAGGAGLSVIDLVLGTELPFPSQLSLSSYAIAGDYFYTAVSGSPRLAIVGLGSAVSTAELDLPAPGLWVAPLPASNALLVTHYGNAGWFTIFGLDALEDGPIAEFRGVLAEGLLDRAASTDEVQE